MSDKTNIISSKYEVEETEILRSQALAQFREWIEKDPNILKCRTDDAFLLRFLRHKKFRIADAYKVLVNYLSARKISPHLFENLSIDDPDVRTYLNMRCAYVFPEVDKKGRLVVISQVTKIDLDIFNTRTGLKVLICLFEYLCLNEISQLNGIVYINDWSGASMAHAVLATPTSIKEFALTCLNTFPLREKMFYFVNLPPFMNGMMQILKSFLSEKIKSRMRIVKGYKEISEEVGINILPKEYGGEIPANDIFKQCVEAVMKNREEILSLRNLDIKVSKSSYNFGNSTDADLDTSIVGSFRKIELD